MKLALTVFLAILSVVFARSNGQWDVLLDDPTMVLPHQGFYGTNYNTGSNLDVTKMIDLWGLDKDSICTYLAKKIDLDMMKVVLARHFGMDFHHMDIDLIRTLMARHFGMDVNMLDLHTMKMIIVKHMMDLEMMRMVFVRSLGMNVDIHTLKMVLAKFLHLSIHVLEDLEVLKMVMVKYMMHVDAMRTMGMHTGITTGIPHYYPHMNFHNYLM